MVGVAPPTIFTYATTGDGVMKTFLNLLETLPPAVRDELTVRPQPLQALEALVLQILQNLGLPSNVGLEELRDQLLSAAGVGASA